MVTAPFRFIYLMLGTYMLHRADMRGRQRVLVVNDDVPLAQSIAQLLRDEGYRTRVAADGEVALQKCVEWPPDLIILDLRMPRVDGWGFLRKRALEPALRRIPVLVLSVESPEGLELARELDATNCLPLGTTGPDELLAAVARLLA
jgi:CheY-like chemotaxis protein